MTPLEQIQQDIQTLPPEALSLLEPFIQLLKKTFSPAPPPKRQWSQQFLSAFGSWQGEPLEREPQGEQPERDALL